MLFEQTIKTLFYIEWTSFYSCFLFKIARKISFTIHSLNNLTFFFALKFFCTSAEKLKFFFEMMALKTSFFFEAWVGIEIFTFLKTQMSKLSFQVESPVKENKWHTSNWIIILLPHYWVLSLTSHKRKKMEKSFDTIQIPSFFFR